MVGEWGGGCGGSSGRGTRTSGMRKGMEEELGRSVGRICSGGSVVHGEGQKHGFGLREHMQEGTWGVCRGRGIRTLRKDTRSVWL